MNASFFDVALCSMDMVLFGVFETAVFWLETCDNDDLDSFDKSTKEARRFFH